MTSAHQPGIHFKTTPSAVMINANCTAGITAWVVATPYGPKCRFTASSIVSVQQAANTAISVGHRPKIGDAIGSALRFLFLLF